MKTAKKIAAMLLMVCMVFGLTVMPGNKIAAEASTEPVKMYYRDSYYAHYGMSCYNVYIKINHNAWNKAVYVHYHNLNGDKWSDKEAVYVTTLSDGSQIWKADVDTYPIGIEYAIKYVGDGQTYWDNNNGNNYTNKDLLGDAVIKVNRGSSGSVGGQYFVSVTLKNLAYTKIVKVRYTEDNWATYQDQDLSYIQSDDTNSIEYWSTSLSLDPAKADGFEYCVYYEVNGQTYWANNFGANYDFTYHTY